MKRITHFLRSSATTQAVVLVSLFPSLVLWSPSLQANPTGGMVTGGAAEIGEGLGGHLQIMQHSQRAVIDWAVLVSDDGVGATSRSVDASPGKTVVWQDEFVSGKDGQNRGIPEGI